MLGLSSAFLVNNDEFTAKKVIVFLYYCACHGIIAIPAFLAQDIPIAFSC